MNNIYKRKIIKHLRALGNRKIKPKYNSVGICGELSNTFKYPCADHLVASYSYSWSKHSGSYAFPVPNKKVGHIKAYTDMNLASINMWDARTRYGKDRLELCLHIANELEKELEADV